MLSRKTRSIWLLWLGFGGLLCLLAFAGLYGLSTIKAIGARNGNIRADYLRQDRILQKVRSDLYLSGSYVRNLLLESDPKQVQFYSVLFVETRNSVQSQCAALNESLKVGQQSEFDKFSAQQRKYFEQMQPALAWTAAERRSLGIPFMKDVLLPERATVVQLADQLSLANARQLESGSREIAQLFLQYERNLVIFTIGSLLVGASLALFAARRMLNLEQLAQQQLQELQHLSSRLVQVQESERRAISRELHDEVGQSISGLLLGIGNVAATLSPDQRALVSTELGDLSRLAERTVASVRNLSLLLRPSMLDDLGLIPALQWQAREVSRTANISVQVTADTLSEDDVSDDTKTCIYRLVQEALANVTRHAAASAVDIQLTCEADRTLTLKIEDNGRGFVPREKGLGILGMEERVRHRNGTFQISSEPGQGTRLLIHLPA
jgi:signal transduction histidine kinase